MTSKTSPTKHSTINPYLQQIGFTREAEFVYVSKQTFALTALIFVPETQIKPTHKLTHIIKRDLSLEDDTYRQLLQTHTGKLSCKTMNNLELQTIIDTMKKKGFKPRLNNEKHPR
uniref:phage protein GemA/Gp16 family protein n=1 Tax=Thaumasiovibrio subtropicus TaxID=1891207 RepID=UPI00131B4914|nr:phage protein GemA/Gp16 family protein [Thaumasiovibrio subtropicus]